MKKDWTITAINKNQHLDRMRRLWGAANGACYAVTVIIDCMTSSVFINYLSTILLIFSHPSSSTNKIAPMTHVRQAQSLTSLSIWFSSTVHLKVIPNYHTYSKMLRLYKPLNGFEISWDIYNQLNSNCLTF